MGINSISGSSFVNTSRGEVSIQPSQDQRERGSIDSFVREQQGQVSPEQNFANAGKAYQNMHAQNMANVQGTMGIQGEAVNMYPNRAGYDENFLGTKLPLPTLGDSIKDQVAMRTDKPGEYELPYTNFSIVMNGERKQCFYTICNIDGSQSQNIKRSGEWEIDGRIPRDCQLGNEAYRNNDIDKGHMVRRLDPCWGKDAKRANNDTFSYCNATLQHGGLNQKEWLELENHVIDTATGEGSKMTVITGPIFREDDPWFDNNGKMKEPAQIPMSFFKTVVWAGDDGNLKSASFVLSQEDIINGDGQLHLKEFTPGRFDVYQVPQKQLEEMTDLHFGNIGDITEQPKRLT